MKVDFLIVGQGLAGSVLAWTLVRRGQRVLVVDRDEAVTSSKVAAGLLTPLAGSRFRIPPGLRERVEEAHRFYWEAEEKTGEQFFHHTRIARLFQDTAEADRWESQRENSECWETFCTPLNLPDSFPVPREGGFEMKQGGWLHVPHFLEATRQWLLERAAYAIAKVDSHEVEEREEGVRWKNVEAGYVIFAEGWKAAENRFFDWLPMNSAAGDILTLKIPGLDTGGRIVNRGKWLLPIGEDHYRVGSNYRHDVTSPEPSSEARAELEDFTTSLTGHEVECVDHQCAIRPIIRRSQVFAGSLPDHPAVVLFNGLGSKGVLNGPWHAARLADYLLDGRPLPEEMDIRSNLLT